MLSLKKATLLLKQLSYLHAIEKSLLLVNYSINTTEQYCMRLNKAMYEADI